MFSQDSSADASSCHAMRTSAPAPAARTHAVPASRCHSIRPISASCAAGPCAAHPAIEHVAQILLGAPVLARLLLTPARLALALPAALAVPAALVPAAVLALAIPVQQQERGNVSRSSAGCRLSRSISCCCCCCEATDETVQLLLLQPSNCWH
jgi:hypothetical protein